ncbi:polyhydroxyalkanoate synthesis regulator DNA-binding domain-containing protein [Tsukamurella sp. 1534]|uniref:polyhydroxyalkanoate synthesis regulator DNA-binding domain-containing protein n=1 Tax=Tsukamurella sp. 1534 TaxID=1151061 RepID=UPI0002D44329|nr:polyhydroxyalkanoate synthesis regulator DNA-binding domain-containing protein [Tsukamurella sp. 1534]
MTGEDPYLIKRYSNRKLYDSVRRRFTTLDEIAGLLDAGVRVVVRDHDVGTDRTDEVLAQVLRRQAQSRPRSTSLLADLLRAPAEVAQTVTGIASPDDSEDAAAAETGAEAKSKPAKKSSGGKTKTAKQTESDDADGDRRDDEIRELREQVSQLTEAVTLLLKDKAKDTSSDD